MAADFTLAPSTGEVDDSTGAVPAAIAAETPVATAVNTTSASAPNLIERFMCGLPAERAPMD